MMFYWNQNAKTSTFIHIHFFTLDYFVFLKFFYTLLEAQTYIQRLCDDTGCNPEDLPKAMNDRETWRERVRDICASRTTWSWWWWWLPYIYIYIYMKKMCKKLIFDHRNKYYMHNHKSVLGNETHTILRAFEI